MNVYTGMTSKPSTSTTSPEITDSQREEVPSTRQPESRKTSTGKNSGQQIEEVIMQVLKKGTDVKRLGKFYEKQQSKN